MSRDGLSSAQVCAAAGVTYRQLDYWCRAGLIRPTVAAAGHGSRRVWSAADVATARRLAELSRRRRATLLELAG
jgi:DNA-binding transcriptional MerR regulator